MLRRMAGVAAGMTAMFAVAACGASTPPSGGNGGSTVSLTAMDYSFSPNQLSVPAGATVTIDLSNTGQTTHSFTLDNGTVSQDVAPGAQTTVTFTAPSSGTLAFHCKYHPTQMKGVITVGGAGGAGGSSSSSSSVGGY